MLKIKFWRIENVVLMKVLEQGAEIKRGGGEFFCKKGFGLYSLAAPILQATALCVKGSSDNYDNTVSASEFPDSEEAKEYIERATEAIHAYNQSLSKEPEQISDDIETVIAE